MNYWESKHEALLWRLSKHYGGGHDQQSHGNWARGMNRGPGWGDIPLPKEIVGRERSKFTVDGDQSFLSGLTKSPNRPKRFRADRQALHDEIVKKFTEGIPVSDDPTFTMMGGGTASGKGTFGRSGKIEGIIWNPNPGEGDYVHVDSDVIKKMLVDGLDITREDWAPFTHEESSYLAKRIMQAAVENGQDYLLDGTGDGSIDSVERKVATAKEKGYKTQAYYVTIGPEEAIRRAHERAMRMPEGKRRHVPPEVTLETHFNVSTVFPEVVGSGLFNRLELYHNGEGEPRLIFSDTDITPPQVLDPLEYRSFLDKPNQSIDRLRTYANSLTDGDGDGRVLENEAEGDMGRPAVSKADGRPNAEQVLQMLVKILMGDEKPADLTQPESDTWDHLVDQVNRIHARGDEVEIPLI